MPADVGTLMRHLSHQFQKRIRGSDALDLLSRNGDPEGPVVVIPNRRGVLLETRCEDLPTRFALDDADIKRIGLEDRLDQCHFTLDRIGRQLSSFCLLYQITLHSVVTRTHGMSGELLASLLDPDVEL